VTLVEACLPWHKHYLVCPAKFVSLVVFADRLVMLCRL